MKAFAIKVSTTLLTAFFLSTSAIAADVAKKDLPKTILIKKDQDGTLYVHRSNIILQGVDKTTAEKLDELEFEKVSSLSDVINVESIVSNTDELDRDLPRQSWYIYYGNYHGYYYPYYPVYYYSYTYYPYYNYGWSGCNYYWYRYY
ncbi:MAG: hypothetical protein V4596_01940 [Bdellovibrionota bacterium]